MSIEDAEHVAWRMIVDAQTGKIPKPSEVPAYLDERTRECGGARALAIGLLVAAGQIVRECAEATGEGPADLVERLRDAHSVEHMDIELEGDDE